MPEPPYSFTGIQISSPPLPLRGIELLVIALETRRIRDLMPTPAASDSRSC